LIVIASNQLIGINVIFYYAKQLFKEVTDNDSEFTQNLMLSLSICQVLSSIVSSRFIDKFGRKYLFLRGQSTLIFILFSVYVIDSMSSYIRIEYTHYLIISLIFIHVITFNCSLGPVCIIYAVELVTDITPIILTLKICSLCVALSTNFLMKTIGLGLMFLIYAFISTLSFIYLSFRMK
jgi:hypothetical protein